MTSKISIINIRNYGSITEAVIESIKLIENDLSFKLIDSKSILLKPNLLIENKNACSQPSIIEGVITYLKNIGINQEIIKIGDSPGQFKTSATKVAKSIGLYDLCQNLGIKFIDFESEAPVKEIIEGAKFIREYFVSKPVKECDVLINLPRLKTHAEATVTGAIKNYWGIIPGGLKAKYHLLGKTEEQFGDVLADNYLWVRSNIPNRLTVYDLHTIMEGARGPVAGNMVKWNLILAGEDELALDLVALEIGKIKGIFVPHLKCAIKRNLGIFDLNEIEFVGLSLAEAKKITPKFKVPNKIMTKIASYLTGNFGYKIMKKIPVINKNICKMCGQCAKICPAEAISFKQENYPYFIKDKCISCLCCLEMCPHHAILTRSRGLAGLF